MLILGIDEVGRGCWAGPLVAGAVLMAADFVLPSDISWRLDDSKVLSKQQRQAADTGIRSLAIAFGLGWVDSREVDNLGLTAAVALAMERAVAKVSGVADEIIIDGSFNFLPHMPQARAVIKADGSVPAVSAASIIAKVARDNYMAEMAQQYPGYGFEQHVGYGTKQHQAALASLGVCPIHRRSYKPVAQLC